MKQFIAIDDMDGRSRADVTTYIGLDGDWRELDLTSDNDRLLRSLLEEWWSKGRKPEHQPRKTAEYRHHVRHGMSSHQYWKEYRAWCDGQGISYTTDSGKFYPSKKTQARFEEYLTAREEAARTGQPVAS